MITRESIEYVKERLSAGVAREKITSDLLGQGGWTMEQVNEAFQYAEQSAPAQMPPRAMASEMTRVPMTIKYFEWSMYASFLASILVWVFPFFFTSFIFYRPASIAVTIIGILLQFFCVYKVSYHRAAWARIVLVVSLAFNASSSYGFFFYVLTRPVFLVTELPIILVTALPIILEIAAIYFVFRAPSNIWLGSHSGTQEPAVYIADNQKWTKTIPRLNNVFIILSALLVFGLDLTILVQEPDLAPFFFAMLVVLVIFISFHLYENRALKQRFSNSDSILDARFVTLVMVRNFVFVLNFVPYIQILGLWALIFGGIPYLIIYFHTLRARNKSVAAV